MQVGGGLLAVATAREVQEMDVSLLLRGGVSWSEDECDVDLMGLATDPATLPDTGFLLIQHQDKYVIFEPFISDIRSLNFSTVQLAALLSISS